MLFRSVAPPAAPPSATPFRPAPAAGEEGETTAEGSADGDMDDDEFENQMSLAAIEAELKPKVVETFDKIADNYKKLRRLQEQDIANQLQSESLSPSAEPSAVVSPSSPAAGAGRNGVADGGAAGGATCAGAACTAAAAPLPLAPFASAGIGWPSGPTGAASSVGFMLFLASGPA